MHRALAAAVLAALALPARADTFDLGDVDKQAHVAVSYGLTLSVAVVLRHHDVPRWQAVAIAAATTLVIGTVKELVDPPYSWNDQLANTLGSAGAAVVVVSFRL